MVPVPIIIWSERKVPARNSPAVNVPQMLPRAESADITPATLPIASPFVEASLIESGVMDANSTEAGAKRIQTERMEHVVRLSTTLDSLVRVGSYNVPVRSVKTPANSSRRGSSISGSLLSACFPPK